MSTKYSGSPLQDRLQIRSSLTLLVTVLVTTFVISGCTSPDPRSDAKAYPTGIETSLQALIEDWRIPSLSICIVEEGEVKWYRGFGVKNLGGQEPVDDETIFQAASMSKPVFAYAVLRMLDEGLLDLDRPLLEYAPTEYVEKVFLHHSLDADGFKKEWFAEITARMALSHSSGLQHFGLKNPVELRFDPGTEFYYSSNGIEYLRYVIEHLKGTRIDSLIAEYVFEPLDMRYSSFAWRDQYDANAAPGHDKYGHSSGSIDRYPSPTAQASLYTNAQDYGKFLSALLTGKGLKKETYIQMMTPQIEASPDVYWGLGLGLEAAPGGQGIWHWGDGGTHQCYFYGDLGQGSGFAYFANSYFGLAILEDIFRLLSEGEHPALSFATSNWSFRGYYLSSSMRFQNLYFIDRKDEALEYYQEVAGKHEKGIQFIDEVSLQSWATDSLLENNILDSVTIMQLLVEAYYPDQSSTCSASASRYKESATNEAAAEYIETVRQTIIPIHFDWTDTQFAWIMDKKIAELRPLRLDEQTLQSYTGSFTPFKLTVEDGLLRLHSEGVGKFELIPINENTFMLKDVNYFKIKMIEDQDGVAAVRGIWSSGRIQDFPRDR